MKTFVIGDIHGAYKALIQCLQRSNFNYEDDELICLGDVADGWSEVRECFDELLKIKNLTFIRGNHDDWLLQWFKFGRTPDAWLTQGGYASIDSYIKHENYLEIIEPHKKLLENSVFAHVDKQHRLFVHGGFNWKIDRTEWIANELMWDRHAFETACMWEAYAITHPTDKKDYFKQFEEVFIGHTATNNNVGFRMDKSTIPLHVSNLWNMDQGAGWGEGKLSIMDVNTKQFWQSDSVCILYPEEHNSRK